MPLRAVFVVRSRRSIGAQFLLAAFIVAAALLGAERAEAVVQGIDVSHHQGVINWTSVKNAGIQFAFCKATEGVDFVDTRFTANMNGAIAAGVPIGPYHFARLNSGETLPTDAVDEANDFADAISPFYNSNGIVLRPVLDLEQLPNDPVSPSVKAYTSEWTRDFCNQVETRLGIAPIIYTNGNLAINYLETDINQYPLWFAKPTTNIINDFAGASPPTTANIGIWGSVGWKFWQWSWTGNIGGINPVDRNAFNGSLLELAQQFSPTYSNGDYNNNGLVDAADFVLWRNTMSQAVNPGTGADGDLSGIIDEGDFNLWKANFGQTIAAAGSAAAFGAAVIPEPTAIALIGAAVFVVAGGFARSRLD